MLRYSTSLLSAHDVQITEISLANLATQTKCGVRLFPCLDCVFAFGHFIEQNLHVDLCSCFEKKSPQNIGLVNVMYCARLSGVTSSGTRVNEGRVFSLVSAGNRLFPRSDKIAGTTHPVSVIEVCHDGFVLHPCNRHIVNSEVAVAKNETIKVERERRHRCLQA